MPAAPIVFLDIAGPNSAAQRDFYAAVFDWSCDGPGPCTPGNRANLDLMLREDPAETVIYIGVPDVTAALEAVTNAGGTVDVPRFEAPGVAVLGLFFDPAGNRVGLVEMDGDRPVTP